MKLLHINNYYEPIGGTEVYLHRLFDALEKRGVENVVVTEVMPNGPTETKRRVHTVAGVTAFVAPASRLSLEGINDILSDEKPTYVHVHSMANPAVLAACVARVPTLRTIHNHDDYSPGGIKYFPTSGEVCDRAFGLACLPYGLYKHCNSRRPSVLLNSYRRTAAMLQADRKVSRLIVASHFVKSCLMSNGFADNRIDVLPYFTPLTEAAVGPSHAPIILFSGRIVKQKGVDRLIDAVRLLKAPFRLVVCGDGPALPEMRARVARLGLDDSVEFTGWLSPVEQWKRYSAARLVVVPSIWPEPFGIVGIEAMSHGLPVVAFDRGGISDWLDNGVTGYLVREVDVRELAEKIDLLLANPQLASRMGREGRWRAEELFSESAHIEKLLRIYRDTADET